VKEELGKIAKGLPRFTFPENKKMGWPVVGMLLEREKLGSGGASGRGGREGRVTL